MYHKENLLQNVAELGVKVVVNKGTYLSLMTLKKMWIFFIEISFYLQKSFEIRYSF